MYVYDEVERVSEVSYVDGSHRAFTAIPGVQDEATFTDHYEQYDAGINVDGFSLLHDEFFDHLVLLPRVQLQKGNPGRVTRSGDGLDYQVEYSYTDDAKNRPLVNSGDVTMLNGPTAGQRIKPARCSRTTDQDSFAGIEKAFTIGEPRDKVM